MYVCMLEENVYVFFILVRFTIEYEKGLQPAGESFLTADQPTRDIPPGYYDTGDGFFDPKTKVVYKSDDLTAILRSSYILY
jgi:hypothetical protein